MTLISQSPCHGTLHAQIQHNECIVKKNRKKKKKKRLGDRETIIYTSCIYFKYLIYFNASLNLWGGIQVALPG